jgi:hypothetical protein
VIDKILRIPELFTALKVAVDRDPLGKRVIRAQVSKHAVRAHGDFTTAPALVQSELAAHLLIISPIFTAILRPV